MISIKFIRGCPVFIALVLVQFASADTRIEILADQPGPVINKDIYGQFMEHLGRGIYEGIWVGEDSDIPNTLGFRNDVIGALKDLHVPVLRWPGGCFADQYHWRDGIGPRDKRPVTLNKNWGGVTENNHFGTHEYFQLEEMLGADAYVNINVGTGTVGEAADWLEYMTSDSRSSLANLRRANGREEPWQVSHVGIGNETWGCGGTMTPEYYASVFKHYATFAKAAGGQEPIVVASGYSDESTEWTEAILTGVPDIFSMSYGAISHHFYTVPSGNFSNKGPSTGFGEDEWFSTLFNTLRMRHILEANVAVLDEHDPENSVAFYVDEWGTWYDVEEGETPGFLYQQNTIRDAVVAALNMNLFHEYAERVQMTNIAQMVNVLQAMILTDKEQMVLTPTYHVYRMYVPFQDATSIPLDIREESRYEFDGESIPRVSATAARSIDGKLYIALVNSHASAPEDIEVELPDDIGSASGQLLAGDRMDARNSFDNPGRVAPVDVNYLAEQGRLSLRIPARSVTVLELE
ncbi:MAG: alpha-L-arabinofuranosidase C-terminal domain-containing protein [Pseudomonadales bacterium]